MAFVTGSGASLRIGKETNFGTAVNAETFVLGGTESFR